ncbi:hypothetical protein [Pontibacter roseus]|uniref:hypothetical protein n=1 Tax=Pontibacter roseus TaxID=336989 RepID=UPI0005272A17|nr:hypothetical protein [Pontibacter roseus]
MTRLNVRLVLVHVLLVLVLSYAFIALGYIYDMPLTELYLEKKENMAAFAESAKGYHLPEERVQKFALVERGAPFAGALFAVVLAFISTRKKKYSYLNTGVVLVAALAFALVGLLDLSLLKTILFAPGRLVSDSVATAYTLNYLLLLVLSFWLALSDVVIPAAGKARQV